MILHARRKNLFLIFAQFLIVVFSSLLIDLLKKSFDTPGTQIDETFFRFYSDLFIYVSMLFYLLKKNLMILQERHSTVLCSNRRSMRGPHAKCTIIFVCFSVRSDLLTLLAG